MNKAQKDLIEEFKEKNPDLELDRVKYDSDWIFYFKNDSNPYDVTEFKVGSRTRYFLENLIEDLENV